MKTSIPALKRIRVCLLASLGIFPVFESAQGCDVPVYYFALFEWRSNPHTLAIGEMPAGFDAKSIAEQVNHSAANVELDQKSPAVPKGHVQIRFPKTNQLWWDAPLPGTNAQDGLGLLLDSPAREKIIHQLEAGVSVVWVLLDSGDTAADDAAYAQLSTRLKFLQKVVSLPRATEGNQVEEGPDPTKSSVPLKIGFDILRVSRKDPKEVGFVAQLLNVVPDLQSVKSPIAYPVFGRALLMSPIYGKYLDHAHIDNWTEFAVGACSCQVKEMNPGIDLLVTGDWDRFLGADRQN